MAELKANCNSMKIKCEIDTKIELRYCTDYFCLSCTEVYFEDPFTRNIVIHV